MTGNPPFENMSHTSIHVALSKGQHPKRPSEPYVIHNGLDDGLWELLTQCWAHEPLETPDITEIIEELDTMWIWSDGTNAD